VKLKVIRIITGAINIPWHMDNTLTRISKDFDTIVVGDGVSNYSASYPDILFINLAIGRKPGLIADFSSLISLIKIFIEHKPDIIHSVFPKSGFLSAIAGYFTAVPVRIHTFTGQVWATRTGLSRILLKLVDKSIVYLNTKCFTDSPSQSLYLSTNNISYKGAPLPVLSKGSLSGVNLMKFDKDLLSVKCADLRNQLDIDESDFIFSFIARKTKDKGAIDVLLAFSKARRISNKCKLLFVGPDEDGEISRLKLVSPDLFLDVLEVGAVSNHEVYLGITNLLCLPSYREGFGSIVIDAAAMGVPTIGSRISGLTDAIEDGFSGLLFRPGDVDEISSVMLSLAADRNTCNLMGRQARYRVENFFTADHLYICLRETYTDLAANPC
jgi:glycosyltransferase involved in cell wall biosynthesis